MKEPLRLRSIRIGTEDHFPGVSGRAGERMIIHEDAIVHTIELHRFAVRSFDQLRVSEDMGRMTADGIEVLEAPGLLLRSSVCASGLGMRRARQKK